MLLNKYMTDEGIEKEYFAVDTFSGFTQIDKQYESSHRSAGLLGPRPSTEKEGMFYSKQGLI